MLHILLLILKIIGIVLLVILGLLVLLLAVILLVPVVWRAEAASGGRWQDIRAHGRITWLLGLIGTTFEYADGTSGYQIRIAWKKLGEHGAEKTPPEAEGPAHETEPEAGMPAPESAPEAAAAGPDTPKPETSTAGPDTPEQEASAAETDTPKQEASTAASGQAAQQTPAQASGAENRAEAVVTEAVQEEEERPQSAESASGRDERHAGENQKNAENVEKAAPKKKKNKKPSAGDPETEKIGPDAFAKRIAKKIKCTFQRFCDKITLLREKKDKAADFLTDDTHVRAFRKGKTELMRLLKRLRPRRLQAEMHFGFSDPGLTGRALAALAILYPFTGDHMQITPDFEQSVLEGSIRVRGRIFLLFPAITAGKLLLSRAVRQTFRDIRNFKL